MPLCRNLTVTPQEYPMNFIRTITLMSVCLSATYSADLLTNTDFTGDLTSWTLQVVPLEGSSTLPGKITHLKEGDDGYVRLERTATGGNTFSVQIYQRAAIEPGKRYICQFKARSPNQAWVAVLLMRDEGDYAASTEMVYQGLDSKWSEITMPMAPKSSATSPLRINFSLDDRSADKVVEITNVTITAAE